jgi:hypothetical protein
MPQLCPNTYPESAIPNGDVLERVALVHLEHLVCGRPSRGKHQAGDCSAFRSSSKFPVGRLGAY